MSRTARATLCVYNEPDQLIESVEIDVKIPLFYAKMLVKDDKFCDALEADLQEFLANKAKLFRKSVAATPNCGK